MAFTTQIYNNASNHGFTKSQQELDTKISEIMEGNTGCVTTMTSIFTYLNSFGYTENYITFENKYWNWWGTHPKDR